MKVLVINFGSTSSKMSIFDNEQEINSVSYNHAIEEIRQFKEIKDQKEYRMGYVLKFIEDAGFKPEDIDCFVSRSTGILGQDMTNGAYFIDEEYLYGIEHYPAGKHAADVGVHIAYDICQKTGKTAIVYDAACIDEFSALAHYSGAKEIIRTNRGHPLNSRGMAMTAASNMGKNYKDMNFVVAHMGGGISVTVHEKGVMADMYGVDEGPFSPERSGALPMIDFVNLIEKEGFDKAAKLLRGGGGLANYLGTSDGREIMKRIEAGDKKAEEVLHALAYQVAKCIGAMATTVCGKVDSIVLTGGMANMKLLCDWIDEYVNFIAPVTVLPGENEMQSLALGALHAMNGEEEIKHVNKISR